MRYMVGMDLGGTNIVCGLVNEHYELVEKIKAPTEAALGSEHVLTKMANMIGELLAKAGVDRQDLIAVGAGCPGFIDPVRGVSVFASNLKWNNVEVSRILGDKVGVPVFIDNDVRMYIFGEAMSGAGRGANVVHGVTIGTGLACATVVNEELYYGGDFMAGELGHVVIDGEKTPCGCGLVGCLETVVSATGIVRQAREALEAGKESLLRAAYEQGTLSAADVSAAYDEGDLLAQEIMEHTGKVLGRGLAYSITLYSPDVVVIGGGASLAGERLLASVRETLKSSVYHGYLERLTIRQGELIDDGGVIGSAAFAKSRVEKWSDVPYGDATHV
ncbi:ROK family protein [Paenibacillus sp. UMB4589-SE434]|uniref:ROK family protein n=1 Tax=Paenibacillus sp. UMB4589-SE434 TaxID=3046314 RepID=UPI00254C0F7D|nr:ROK family protein [Paenibacillus sp. UMB4589-SE434]MDK8181934.1 ROK family protein [Paenibacillus sp. UMB4589-SE434]